VTWAQFGKNQSGRYEYASLEPHAEAFIEAF
jgi:hypothetical protein